MDIIFRTAKLRKVCNDAKQAARTYGTVGARKLRLRLDELRAAETLADMLLLPQARCHELKADLAGKISLNLQHPYRLIIEPANDPAPTRPDGGLDWQRITAVRVLGTKDTHG